MPRATRQPTSITRAWAQTQRAPLGNINPCTIGNSTTDVDDDFNAAFFNEFDQEESWRFRERSQMTDEEHAAFLERAKNAPSVARSWAKSTKFNVYTLDKKWTAYCAKYNLGDPEEALPTTDQARAMGFLTFMCANYDINTTDTLWQYFRVWRQLYHHIVREEFNSVDSGDVYHFYKAEVIKAYQLRNSQAHVRTITDSLDLLVMMIHNIAYDKWST